MFGFLVPSYSPDTCLSNCTSQQGKHITELRSSDLNCKHMTPSDLFTDTLCAPIQQLGILNYNLISIRFWPRFQGLDECHIK